MGGGRRVRGRRVRDGMGKGWGGRVRGRMGQGRGRDGEGG